MLTPLQRELELLRSQTYGEGQFAVTFRRMEGEKKEMAQKQEGMQKKMEELSQEIDVLSEKYGSLMDELQVNLYINL